MPHARNKGPGYLIPRTSQETSQETLKAHTTRSSFPPSYRLACLCFSTDGGHSWSELHAHEIQTTYSTSTLGELQSHEIQTTKSTCFRNTNYTIHLYNWSELHSHEIQTTNPHVHETQNTRVSYRLVQYQVVLAGVQSL
jgi:hypothetical protein